MAANPLEVIGELVLRIHELETALSELGNTCRTLSEELDQCKVALKQKQDYIAAIEQSGAPSEPPF